MTITRRRAAGLCAAALACSVALPASAEFYEGQTIRIVIPFSAGGGTDTFGRLIAAHLGRHIPGNPTVIAENVTGAGGILGSNEFARSERDGLTLLTASGHLNLRAFLGLEGLELDLNDLVPVVAAPMGHVTALHSRAGIDDPTELLQMQGRITKGITDPVGLIESIVALEMFGIEYRPVPGFGGRGDTRLAFERGELMINTQATPAFNAQVVPLVEEGTAMVAYAIGFVAPDGTPIRDPGAPDIITAPELYEQIHGEMPSGEAWEAFRVVANLVQNTRGTIWVFEDAPEEARAALRAGVDAMVLDPEFLTAAADILEGYEIISGEGLDQIKADLDAAPEEILEWLRNLMTERFEVSFNPR
ncbi:MAG: Bug family tripartite tricarboxylate transporter substrate binding protein [Alkalilacustris sp.]